MAAQEFPLSISTFPLEQVQTWNLSPPVPSHEMGIVTVLEGIEWEGLHSKCLAQCLVGKHFSVNVSIVGALEILVRLGLGLG